MTGPSAPDPAVETVTRTLAEHQYGGMQDVHDNLICSCGLICRDFPVHQTAVVVAALRAAAGTADVDDLAETVGWLAVGVESLSDRWDEEAGGFMDHEVRRRLEACRDELRAALRAGGGS